MVLWGASLLLGFLLFSPSPSFSASLPYPEGPNPEEGSGEGAEGPVQRIAIVGAGVIGLSTASAILELHKQNPQLPAVSIDIFADLQWEHTLSRGIAGLFRVDQGTNINRIYGNETFTRMARLFREVGGVSGVQLVSGHILSDNLNKLESQLKFYGDIVYNFRFLTPREIRQQFKLDNYSVHAIHYTAYTSEGLKYCPFMRELLEKEGVRFHYGHIERLEDLALAGYDTVINCAGLHGAVVANDGDEENTYPIRGVLLKVDAPWQKHFLYRDFATFTIPVIDGVYVGTVKEDYATDMNTSAEELEHIFNKYLEIQPAMSSVAILSNFVGLRPGRSQVRVQSYDKPFGDGGRTFKVVHNYGHGGNGFTLGWGTALHAARLALGLDTAEFDKAQELDDVIAKYANRTNY